MTALHGTERKLLIISSSVKSLSLKAGIVADMCDLITTFSWIQIVKIQF